MSRLASFVVAVLVGLFATPHAFGWGSVTGPWGGAAYRGPAGGAAVRGPYGGGAVRGPYGAGAVRGPDGAAAVRGPYGATAVRPPYPPSVAPRAVVLPAPVPVPYTGPAYVSGVRPWVRAPYYGVAVAGVTIGVLIAVTAPPPPPVPGLCWYWTSSAHTHGYWDYCS